MREDAEDAPAIREFAALSEQELDRIETLVQNLLKITKLDAGTITLEKTVEKDVYKRQSIGNVHKIGTIIHKNIIIGQYKNGWR